MTLIPKEEKDHIIRDYFGPASDQENPRCPHCGEVFKFSLNYPSKHKHLTISVHCPECSTHFTWKQTSAEQSWNPLHLQYFEERYRIDQTIRCPRDDCYVTYTEFNDGVVEFRCPYCNHRGKIRLS